MLNINLFGRVVHGIPINGITPPCVRATVQVYDIDQGGNGNDLIWSGQTDVNGYFRGTGNWKDYNAIKVIIPTPPIWVPLPLPGHWEQRPPITVEQEIPDILLLKVVISQDTPTGRQSKEFPFAQGVEPIPSSPLIVDWPSPNPPLTKNDRVVVVVNHLVGEGPGNWQWLYAFLEESGVNLADRILGPVYKTVRQLVGTNATKQNFLNTLTQLCADTSIKAIDVILNLHGGNETLYFSDNKVSMNTLEKNLLALNCTNKLRMLYSGACYGKTHADKFVKAGFNTAVGAARINANSATEYPIVLTMWAAGSTIAKAVAVGENPMTRIPADAVAREIGGFSDVNSDKDIVGDGNLTISSNV